MKKNWAVFTLFLMLASASLFAQQEPRIRQKTMKVIPKLDLYWSAVMIADGFPSFFPVELELNFPGPRISAEFILSPWATTYRTQFSTTKEKSFSGGLGIRYYFLPNKQAGAATGAFVEPQYLVRSVSQKTQYSFPPNTPDYEHVSSSGGFFLGLGYQHVFVDRIYLQARLSGGLGSGSELVSYRLGNNFLLLPWVGIGVNLN